MLSKLIFAAVLAGVAFLDHSPAFAGDPVGTYLSLIHISEPTRPY